jgi:hypothetical protein
MVKFQEFYGESVQGSTPYARDKALTALNEWLKEFDVKIIGIKWCDQYNRELNIIIFKIEIMYYENS